jgi:hypothetical protein
MGSDENISMGCTNCMQAGSDVDWAPSIPWLYFHSSQLLNNVIGWGVDYIGYLWHPPLASPVVIMWEVVSRHLFLNIIPNNFMVGIGRNCWCSVIRGRRPDPIKLEVHFIYVGELVSHSDFHVGPSPSNLYDGTGDDHNLHIWTFMFGHASDVWGPPPKTGCFLEISLYQSLSSGCYILKISL